MPDVRIVLVEPKFEGNIGAIARSMANFGFSELYMVNPCEIGDDAWRRAKHGSHILEGAVVVDTFEEAIKDCFFVAGTSGKITEGDKNYARVPISADSFAERIDGYGEKTAVVFGREDYGLLQDELERCDILVHVPSEREYPILNISHAATIVMYEIHGKKLVRPAPADLSEKERMFEFFDELLHEINYPEHRLEITSLMFRRMMGRSIPTKWEYNTIMGVFKDASKLIREKDH